MTIPASNPDELGSFPERHWEVAPTRRWHDLCCGLRDYVPPRRLFSVPHIRKWEVVSAFQKAVRRGDGQTWPQDDPGPRLRPDGSDLWPARLHSQRREDDLPISDHLRLELLFH